MADAASFIEARMASLLPAIKELPFRGHPTRMSEVRYRDSCGAPATESRWDSPRVPETGIHRTPETGESRVDAQAQRRQGQNTGEIPRRPPRRTPRNDKRLSKVSAKAHASAAPGRRAYNREYMRQWRRRNRERYLEYNRAYHRKTAHRRKLRQIAGDAECGPKCAYGCGRQATQTIERIDPRTWQPVSVPYCGSC
jgi:hypothetical protein